MLLGLLVALRSCGSRKFRVGMWFGVALAVVASSGVPVDGAGAAEQEQKAAAPGVQGADQVYECAVVDAETGKPIANAKVTVTLFEGGRGIGASTNVTDGDGNYAIEIGAEYFSRATVSMSVRVDHDDYVRNTEGASSLSRLRQKELQGARPFFERIALQPAAVVKGKVVAPDGFPLGGVSIKGFTRVKSKEYTPIMWLDSKTAADGSFELKLNKKGVAALWILPEDLAIFEKVLDEEAGDLGNIRLPEGTRIVGRAVDADGKPAVGVALMAQRGTSWHGVGSGVYRRATTDEEGRFRFAPLPEGEYRVVADDFRRQPGEEDSFPGVFVGETVKVVEGVAEAPVELRAKEHIHVHAQYLTSQNTKTEGHRFSVSGEMAGQFWTTSVEPNRDGTATARVPRGLQNVHVMLTVSDESGLRYRRGPGKPTENWMGSIDLGTLDEDFAGLEVIRYKAPVVFVRVVDETAQPIKVFEVTGTYPWSGPPEDKFRWKVYFQPQEDGRQRSKQMLPDEDVTIGVTAKGYQPGSAAVKLAEGETKEVVVTLKKAEGNEKEQ